MASLSPHTGILGLRNARHLLRRATFVYTKTLIDQYAALTPQQALDLLVLDNPLTVSQPYDPVSFDVVVEPTRHNVSNSMGYWIQPLSNNSDTYTRTNGSALSRGAVRRSYLSAWWWYNAIHDSTLKYKLSFFLYTRFTVERNAIAISADFYDYLCLLLFYAYGSYKTLAEKMTLNNAMLLYLDNTTNNKNAPNENYAREFLELFTIGKGAQIAAGNYTNYTEADIVQAAKVLSGFKRRSTRADIDTDTNLPKGYNATGQHDSNDKTFSSAFNNAVIDGVAPVTVVTMDTELHDFVEMVFGQMATAQHICRKLYQYFVKANISSEVETDIIQPLATQLQSNGYQILPVVRTLLESQHFYDLDDSDSMDENIGAIIKSPLQLLSEMVSFFQANIPSANDISTQTNNDGAYKFYQTFWNLFLDQDYFNTSNMPLFSPDSVAGYPPYYQAPDFNKLWIGSSSMIGRHKLIESLLDNRNRITGGNSPIQGYIDICAVIKNGGIISNPADSTALVTELCNNLFAQEPDVNRINYFLNDILLAGLGAYNWTSSWNNYLSTNNTSVVEPRLKSLVTAILRAPESQIF